MQATSPTTARCFTCGIELHQRLHGNPHNSRERSFPTCFAGERICSECEASFVRKDLPRRRVGLIAEAPRYRVPPVPKDLKLAVEHGIPYDRDGVVFIPAS